MANTNQNVSLQASQQISLKTEHDSTSIQFDLSDVKMTAEQREIVSKLFAQQPKAEIVWDGHDPDEEAGKQGPGSKFLTAQEFEKIRKLGVRIKGVSAPNSLVADFCLHILILPRLK